MQNRLQGGLKPGVVNAYEYSTCIRTNQKIGKGVYFSNHIEVCEAGYASSTVVGDKSFKIVFQCRVNPIALRQCEKTSDVDGKQGDPDWDNDYFVINNSFDIRPYRILIKED